MVKLLSKTYHHYLKLNLLHFKQNFNMIQFNEILIRVFRSTYLEPSKYPLYQLFQCHPHQLQKVNLRSHLNPLF